MLVVADSSPINFLIQIAYIELLPTRSGYIDLAFGLDVEATGDKMEAYVGLQGPSWLFRRLGFRHSQPRDRLHLARPYPAWRPDELRRFYQRYLIY